MRTNEMEFNEIYRSVKIICGCEKYDNYKENLLQIKIFF